MSKDVKEIHHIYKIVMASGQGMFFRSNENQIQDIREKPEGFFRLHTVSGSEDAGWLDENEHTEVNKLLIETIKKHDHEM